MIILPTQSIYQAARTAFVKAAAMSPQPRYPALTLPVLPILQARALRSAPYEVDPQNLPSDTRHADLRVGTNKMHEKKRPVVFYVPRIVD